MLISSFITRINVADILSKEAIAMKGVWYHHNGRIIGTGYQLGIRTGTNKDDTEVKGCISSKKLDVDWTIIDKTV